MKVTSKGVRGKPYHFSFAPQVSAAAAAVLQEGAELILGPLFSAEVAAVAPLARARNVSVVAFSTDVQVAGEGVYLLGFVPQQQVDRIAAGMARVVSSG